MILSEAQKKVLNDLKNNSYPQNCYGGYELRTIKSLINRKLIDEDDFGYHITKRGKKVLFRDKYPSFNQALT